LLLWRFIPHNRRVGRRPDHPPAGDDIFKQAVINDILRPGFCKTRRAAFRQGFRWKLGQMKPNEFIKFRAVSVSEAQALRLELDDMCTLNSIE